MNFGAINDEGGEKRLNVAITRARREFHVFSSIRSEDVDLGRTRAVGVRHLKHFLGYAERGSIALPSHDEGSLGPAENPFEEAVASVLRRYGWEVRTQIGVSGFRVDLGVVHPDHAGAYIAGIECDGALYHSSATARDRDKLRQAVLEGLGWSILRVWSTEWFRDSTGVSEGLHAALEKLLRKDRKDREARAVMQCNAQAEDENGASAVAVDDDSTAVDAWGRTEGGVEVDEADPVEAVADPDRFFDDDYAATLCRIILGVVEREGPMPLHELARKVAQVHGWQRTGRRIQEQVRNNLGAVEKHMEAARVFVWAPGSHASRIPFRGLNERAVRDISRAEIASVIDAHEALLSEAEDPALDLSRLLGIARLSKKGRAYLSGCILWRKKGE